MKSNYILHSTCFDRDLMRKQIICLNDNGIDYKLENKEIIRQFRVPQNNYFEAEIYINKKEFELADKLLKDVIDKFS